MDKGSMGPTELQSTVAEINTFLQTKPWLDFEIIAYDQQKLTVIGSIDPSSRHNIEIYFDDVFFVSSPVEWKTDTTKIVLCIIEGEQAVKLNIKFRVEIGYFIFQFVSEDYPEDFGCLIAARNISYLIL